MAVVRSILTLDGCVQLFLEAFDMLVTGVPLKVALGYQKIVFGRFKKIIMMLHLRITWVISAFWANKE